MRDDGRAVSAMQALAEGTTMPAIRLKNVRAAFIRLGWLERSNSGSNLAMWLAIAITSIFLLSDKANAAEHCPTPYVSETVVDDLTAHPKRIVSYYEICREAFIKDLGPDFADLNEDGRKLAWAFITSYGLRPYGTSRALTLGEILADRALDCDNYAMLTYHLFKLLAPQSPVKTHIVGWNGGAVGNHAQIFATGTGIPLLVDPTVGVVAHASFDQIASGKAAAAIRDLHWRTELASYRERVINALTNGLYKPSDLLYFFAPERYPDTPGSAVWATPQASAIE